MAWNVPISCGCRTTPVITPPPTPLCLIVGMWYRPSIHPSIHPFISFHLFRLGCWGQQPKQKDQNLPLHHFFHQLFHEVSCYSPASWSSVQSSGQNPLCSSRIRDLTINRTFLFSTLITDLTPESEECDSTVVGKSPAPPRYMRCLRSDSVFGYHQAPCYV